MSNPCTVSVLVENRNDALLRLTGLLARRGFELKSLTTGKTENHEVLRMTLVADTAGKPSEQLTQQLCKLINVLAVRELGSEQRIDRELALIKVKSLPGDRSEVLKLAAVFRANVIDVDGETLIIEATGSSSEIDALQKSLDSNGVTEMVRTGCVALQRGCLALKAANHSSVPNPDARGRATGRRPERFSR